jgi:IMP cyclohydrolase
MTTIGTYHEKEHSQQTTIRRVTYEDAAGREYVHEFEQVDGAIHAYLGDGDPSEKAVDALDEWLNEYDYDGLDLTADE